VRSLAGPFFVVAAVLGVAGMSKLARPGSLADSMGRLGLPRSSIVARAVGGVEVAIAVGALGGHRWFAALTAVAYVVFAVFVVALLRTAPGARSCGCFAGAEAPPKVLHVVVDLLAAAVAAGAAIGDGPGLFEVLGDQPLLGLPFLILAATAVYLVLLVETALPALGRPTPTGPGTQTP